MDLFNNEQIALAKCQEVIDYYTEHGKYPFQTTKDKKINSLGSWLRNSRSSKQGKGLGKFYPSLQSMAVKSGLPDMFNLIDKEQLALAKCQEIIDYYTEHGKYPSQASKDKNIKLLGIWLKNLRGAKQGKGTNTFYPSLDVKAERAGLPDMFNTIDLEQVSLAKCQQVIDYYKEHGKYPSHTSKDINIRKLSHWLNMLRAAKQGNRKRGIFYPSLQSMTTKVNLPNIFNKNWLDDL